MNKTQQQDTLDRWLTAHGGVFYRLVRVDAFNHHDQEDLFQEIVIQVWKSIPNFKGTAKHSAGNTKQRSEGNVTRPGSPTDGSHSAQSFHVDDALPESRCTESPRPAVTV